MPNWSKALEIAQCEKGVHYYYSKKPFECLIPGGLIDGRKIYIHALCPQDAQRFSVNFQMGSDIAFHLNPRFDEGDIVMNSRSSDEWGNEERTGKLPFRQMTPFLICITTIQQGYELEINNEWIAVFDHRVPFDKVTSLQVEGDVDIIGIHIHNNEMYKENLISIPGGVEPSQTFVIAGKCDSDCSEFYLNLQCGDSVEDDVALHFNPRGGDTNQVIRNSYISGSWGDEERDGDFPFAAGNSFTIAIVTLVDGFQVKVNGNRFTKYAHRLPISRICKMVLKGDAKLRDVVIEHESTIQVPSMCMTAELNNPDTPAKVDISDFKPGSEMTVAGTVHGDPSRIKINFQAGPDEDDDVILHINPRWDQGEPKIVINSRQGGSWADEEIWSQEFPFKGSSPFELTVRCQEEGYAIIINGVNEQFKHRIDCGKVTHVCVDGSLDVNRVVVW